MSQAYGAAGVVKIVRILEREITTGMRLLGVSKVSELKPEMVSVPVKVYRHVIDPFLEVERVDWQPHLRSRL